jgi:formylglycine-generating enzyme required for sulfatase activity
MNIKKRRQDPIFSNLDIEWDGPEPNKEEWSAMVLETGHPEVFKSKETPAGIRSVTAALSSILDAEDVESLGLSFVHIAPGSFVMGSPKHEQGRNLDEEQHKVILTRGFSIQTTPVTQRHWKMVMKCNPAQFSGERWECPVEKVSWIECQEFIRRLNARSGNLHRLPTEAEWEFACRAGSRSAFYSGDIKELYCEVDAQLDAVGWYCGNSERKPHPVAQKRPNAWGLFDMLGNVNEWCSDWYGPYPEGTPTDPAGPDFGTARVVRGGSWFSSAKDCRSASRFHASPNSKCDSIGFRLVKVAP